MRDREWGPCASTCGVFLMRYFIFTWTWQPLNFPNTISIPSAQLLYIHAFSLHHHCSQFGLSFPLLSWRWCRDSWPKLLTSYMENLNGDPGQVIHGSAWTPDLHLSLSQDFVSHGALTGKGPCSMSMPGNTRVSRGPVDAMHLIRSLSVLTSSLQHGQSRWESARRILVLDSVTVILILDHPR